MEWLIRLIIGLLALFVAIESPPEGTIPPQTPTPTPFAEPGAPTEPGDQETFNNPLSIDSVEFIVMESMPPQVRMHVMGGHDGCEFPVTTEIAQDGNTINVSIYREMPLAIACPAIYVMYEDTVDLGMLEPGTYTVNVNDKTYTLEL